MPRSAGNQLNIRAGIVEAEQSIVDSTQAEAFVVRKNQDGDDVLTVDTSASEVKINGNLNVQGTLTYVSSTAIDSIDELILLASNNVADLRDIGFFGLYNDGTNRYAGLFRDASDSGKFKLFRGLTALPTTSINTGHASYQTANLVVGQLEGTIATAVQTGITQLGTLSGLDVSGNITVTGNVDGVDLSSFKSDYDSKVNQDVRGTATPVFVGLNLSGNLLATSHNLYNIGSSGSRWLNAFVTNLNAGGSVTADQFIAPNNSASYPAYRMASSTTGMFGGTGQIGFSTSGTQRLLITDTQITSSVNISTPKVTLPEATAGISLQIGDSDTGIRNNADGDIRILCNNIEVLKLQASGLETAVSLTSTNTISGTTVTGSTRVRAGSGFRNLQLLEVCGSVAAGEVGLRLDNSNATGYEVIRFAEVTGSGQKYIHAFNGTYADTTGAFRRTSFNFWNTEGPITIGVNGTSNPIEFYQNGTTSRRVFIDNNSLTLENSTVLRAVDGSAGSPSLTFDANRNTGIWRTTTNSIGFSTGGTNRMTLNDSSLYVSHKISVGTDNDNFIDSNADGQMRFGTDNAERMRLVNQGLLINRISHTTSNCRLDIDGDVRSTNTNGEIRYISITTTCSANNTWYKVDTTGVDLVGSATYSSTNDDITITTRGRFRCEYSISFYATTGFITRAAIFQGGSVVTKSIREMFHASTAGSGAPRSLAGSFLVDVFADTTFDLRVQVSDGASQDVVIKYGTLILHRV
jgi:hypothetical protein